MANNFSKIANGLEVPAVNISGLTASTALITDASKNVTSSVVTSTELALLSGLTSVGNVTGPGSAVANAVALYNGTTGKIIKNSSMTIDTNGAISNSLSGGTATTLTINNGTASAGILDVINNATNVFSIAQTGLQTITSTTGAGRLVTMTSTPSGNNDGALRINMTMPASGIGAQASRVDVTLTGTATQAPQITAHKIAVSGGNISTGGSELVTGLNIDIANGITNKAISTNGNTNVGINIDARVAATTSGNGNIGIYSQSENGNIGFGLISTVNSLGGTTPKGCGAMGVVFGSSGTMPTNYSGIYARLHNTYSTSVNYTVPTVNAAFVGDNGNTSADLINLLNSGSSVFKVDSTGTITSTGQISMPSGALETAPPYSFTGDLDTGIYHRTANELNISCGAVRVCDFTTSSQNLYISLLSDGAHDIGGNTGHEFRDGYFNSSLRLTQAGAKLEIKEGSDAAMGTAVLVGGTVTVTNAIVTANSRIFLTIQSLGTVSVPQAIAITARIANTSFTITSASITDTSTIAWHIIEAL